MSFAQKTTNQLCMLMVIYSFKTLMEKTRLFHFLFTKLWTKDMVALKAVLVWLRTQVRFGRLVFFQSLRQRHGFFPLSARKRFLDDFLHDSKPHINNLRQMLVDEFKPLQGMFIIVQQFNTFENFHNKERCLSVTGYLETMLWHWAYIGH